MFNHVWYDGLIRRYIVLFGTIFNQIYITRTDDSGNSVSTIRVPIVYGPKDKVLSRLEGDPELSRPFGSILPYMTFEWLHIRYDADRHLATQNREVGLDANKDLAAFRYTGAPFNFLFELNIVVKNAEDGVRILEQIMPFFTPTWTASVEIVDDPAITKNIALTFLDHSMVDSWQGSYEDRRYISHTLRFEMQAWLFGPALRGKIVKKFEGNFTIQDAVNPSSTITVTPGMDANGVATSDADLTVPYSQIDWEDDFGFVTVKTET